MGSFEFRVSSFELEPKVILLLFEGFQLKHNPIKARTRNSKLSGEPH